MRDVLGASDPHARTILPSKPLRQARAIRFPQGRAVHAVARSGQTPVTLPETCVSSDYFSPSPDYSLPQPR